ncbi:MAG TPA: hypothetical protein V6C58_24705 [Allocoleopsis sp.]
MEKAFDTKVLVEDLKAAGLPMAEDLAKKGLEVFLNWTVKSAAIHDNALVKTIVPIAVASIKPVLEEQVDKIDGQVG